MLMGASSCSKCIDDWLHYWTELNRTQSTTLTTLNTTASESLENPNSFDVLYADCRPLYLLLLCWCARVCVIALVKMKCWGRAGNCCCIIGGLTFSQIVSLWRWWMDSERAERRSTVHHCVKWRARVSGSLSIGLSQTLDSFLCSVSHLDRWRKRERRFSTLIRNNKMLNSFGAASSCAVQCSSTLTNSCQPTDRPTDGPSVTLLC